MNKFSQEFERAMHGNMLRRKRHPDTFDAQRQELPPSRLLAHHRRSHHEDPMSERRPIAPVVPALTTNKVDNHLVSLLTAHSFEAEQYRKLSSLIERFHDQVGLSAIAISSAAAGDGKTTTAINLAAALAKASDRRVLLMDFDLWRPSISAYLGEDEGDHQGILDLIQEPQLELNNIVIKLKPLNLSILFAGAALTTSHEAPAAWQLEAIFTAARQQYGYIIVDTPPIFPFLDCQLVEPFVDGFLLVVAKHKTPRQLVGEAIASLDPNKVVGVVLNNSEKKRVSGYYGYTGYYQYGSRRATNAQSGIVGRLLQKWRTHFRRKDQV